MKRSTVRSAIIVTLVCLSLFGVCSLNAVEVKLRPSTKPQEPAKDERKTSGKTSPDSKKILENSVESGRTTESEPPSKTGSKAFNEKNAQEDVPDRSSVGEKKTKARDREGNSGAKVEKEQNSFLETMENDVTTDAAKSNESPVVQLPAVSDKPLELLSDEEREKRYPRVQGATLMTVGALIPTKNLHNVRVLRAFTRIPRVDFVSKKQRKNAYMDVELQLDSLFWAPRPYDVAYALEALDPQETDKVLVVETGGGYHAAVLSFLVAEVYAVGMDRNGVKRAADACKKHGYANVFHQVGNPVVGWEEAAPFDKIIVTRAVEEIPLELIEQLKEGGKIVAPVGGRYRQLVVLGEKKNGELLETTLEPTRVELLTPIPLERNLPTPELIGGDFEELDPAPARVELNVTEKQESSDTDLVQEKQNVPFTKRGATPVGWYDAWNFEVVERGDSYSGKRVCVFSNEAISRDHEKRDRNEERTRAATLPEERGEKTEADETVKKMQRENELRCQMRQSFAVDGSVVRKLTVSGAYRATILNSRCDRQTARIVSIEFFDKERKLLGESAVFEAPLAPCVWKEFSNEIIVPAKSKEATLTIGLIDGVGLIEMDALEVRDKFEKTSKDR